MSATLQWPRAPGGPWGPAGATSAIPYRSVPASCHPFKLATEAPGLRPQCWTHGAAPRPPVSGSGLSFSGNLHGKDSAGLLTKGLSEGVTFTLPGTESAGTMRSY